MLAVPTLVVADDSMTTTSTQTSSTTSAGTVSDFSPDAITVRTTTTSSPVSYSYSKTTTYVDENGNPVSVDVVKSGAPVTVYYTGEAGHAIASKVVVHRIETTAVPVPTTVIEEKKTTTTTTSTSSGQ